MLGKHSAVFEDIVFGPWTYNTKTGISGTDKAVPILSKSEIKEWVQKNPKGCLAYQPVVFDPYDEDSLMRMRKILQDYVLLHIKAIHQQKSEDARHGVASAGNLVYKPSPMNMKKVQQIIDHMSTGADLSGVLRQKGYKVQFSHSPYQGNNLVLFFTDLEPDDIMAIAQLTERKHELKQLQQDPVIVFISDLNDSDRGTVFDKKLLLATFMLGRSDAVYVLQAEDIVAKKDPLRQVHASARSRREACSKTCQQLRNVLHDFDGDCIEVYIMAPCRGMLAQVFTELRQDVKWQVTLYSGSHNIKGSIDADFDTIKRIATIAERPLVDIAKVAFFGRTPHPWTASLTTFANETFAFHVTMQNPMLSAVLKKYDEEKNSLLVEPKWDAEDQTYKVFNKSMLSKAALDRFAKEVKPLWKYNDGDALTKYCKKLYEDAELYHAVKSFKKSTVSAFAFGGCDSPLCDQLIFLHEWLCDEMSEALVKPTPGRWTIVGQKAGQASHTAVEHVGNVSKGGTLAIQPHLRAPEDEDALKTMRECLENMLLKHLKRIECKSESVQIRSAGNLMYAPTRDLLAAAHTWIDSIHSTDTWSELHERLCEVYATEIPEALSSGTGDHLMMVFTNLEVDQTMAIAQLWNWKNEKELVGKEPLLIFCTDELDSEAQEQYSFSQRLFLATLLLGISDYKVLLPVESNVMGHKQSMASVMGSTTKQRKTLMKERENWMEQICQCLSDFKNEHEGGTIELYVMSPCWGNLAAVFERLDKSGIPWQSFKWKVSLHTGSWDIDPMQDSDDLKLLEKMSLFARIVESNDSHFFGEDDDRRHALTYTFTNFAPESFVQELNLASPLLAATLKWLNSTINAPRVAPDDRSLFDPPLTEQQQAHFEETLAPLFGRDMDSLAQYCNALCDDDLFYKLRPAIGSSVAACACGGCDLPLVAQTMFLQEWLKDATSASIVEVADYLDTGEFSWRTSGSGQAMGPSRSLTKRKKLEKRSSFDGKVSMKSQRSEDGGKISTSGIRIPITRYRMENSEDEETLTLLRNASMKCLMRHLRMLNYDQQEIPSSWVFKAAWTMPLPSAKKVPTLNWSAKFCKCFQAQDGRPKQGERQRLTDAVPSRQTIGTPHSRAT
jgi:hypothetical protein